MALRAAPAVFAALALAACASPVAPLGPVTEGDLLPMAGSGAAPDDDAPAREREVQRRGVGLPPPVPDPSERAVDRVPGTLRALRPAPGTGPVGPPPAPPPANSLSRLRALPASPLANPPGFGPGRP